MPDLSFVKASRSHQTGVGAAYFEPMGFDATVGAILVMFALAIATAFLIAGANLLLIFLFGALALILPVALLTAYPDPSPEE